MIITYRKITPKLIFSPCLSNHKGVIIYIIYPLATFKDFVDNHGMYSTVSFVPISYIIVNEDHMMYKHLDV